MYIFTDDFQLKSLEALEKIRNAKERTENRRIRAQEKRDRIEEWKFVSRVLDRLLFYCFILAVSGFNINLLTSTPFVAKDEYCPLGKDMCEGMTREEIDQLIIEISTRNGHVDLSAHSESGGGHL